MLINDVLCVCLLLCRLTDDVSRENWEKYGNPDGPQAATFGIALPSWIVSEENSIWLLLLYIGVFVFGLPIIVVSNKANKKTIFKWSPACP